MATFPDQRVRAVLRGVVQGVGFRPFVALAAAEGGLSGFVRNTVEGVELEVEGPPVAVEAFLARVRQGPPGARVDECVREARPARGEPGFHLLPSRADGPRALPATADAAPCRDCRRELFDPADRRHRYPFLNCAACGPRWSVLRALPWDRPNTTMAGFPMCPACAAEYGSPADRRFHAQPTACPACGPTLRLGDLVGDAALRAAEDALRAGRIVAVLGVGGFQLCCDARDEDVVTRLRARKRRSRRPFAVLAPSLDAAHALAVLTEEDVAALTSPACPIVLAPSRGGLARAVAPGGGLVGLMLPASPLHLLLATDLGFPLVCTSANASDEPMATHPEDPRLGALADVVLAHDRPVARAVDDGVARRIDGRVRVMRRARGTAPGPLPLDGPPLLALGGDLKGAVALSDGRRALLSQHLGDLGHPLARAAFVAAIDDLRALGGVTPVAVAVDLHPDYASARHADTLGLPVVRVQHHHAHAASCLVENGAWGGRALAATWDGVGLGDDGGAWGGELLRLDGAACTRVGHLRPLRLPGGDAAAREPRRVALALLHELGRDGLADAFAPEARALLTRMLDAGVRCPPTTSVGRLFDGVAALCGLATVNDFEGEAALALEAAAAPGDHGAYPLPLVDGVLDWGPLVEAVLDDLGRGADVVSARFHAGLAEGLAAAAGALGEETVALSGGCFQNARLTDAAATALRRRGHRVLLHHRVPPNDGGLALGQLAIAGARVG